MQRAQIGVTWPQAPRATGVYLRVEDERPPPDETQAGGQPERPPGDFTSEELEADTARFLEELRRRAEQQRRIPRRRSGPPPPPGRA